MKMLDMALPRSTERGRIEALTQKFSIPRTLLLPRSTERGRIEATIPDCYGICIDWVTTFNGTWTN